jgi:GNAT superfamily N-acetyltransferase
MGFKRYTIGGKINQMKNISINRPTSKDIEELHQLFKTVITDTYEKEGLGDYHEEINNEIEEKKEFLQEYIESYGKKRFFLIASYQDKIVGVISYGPCGELIKELSNNRFDHVGEIGTAFVLPEYHNKGIGTILLNSMCLSLIGMNIDEFCLDSGYTIAKQIWRKKLGEPAIVVKDYWGEGYDHIIWYRKLKDINISFKLC